MSHGTVFGSTRWRGILPPAGVRTFLVGALLLWSSSASAERSFLLVVSGLGGEERYEDAFRESSLALLDAAESAGLEPDQTTLLAEDPSKAPDRIDGRSTKEEVLSAIEALGKEASPGDNVWIVLVGHGAYRDGLSRINLPGPDLSDADFAVALTGLNRQRVVFVNTTPASGGFLQTLAGENRVIVTATKSAAQRNETTFGRYFSDAFVGGRGDADVDGRVSALEAFQYATREVARYYETEKLLVTEQALLDDNGDGEGSADPQALGGESGSLDGLLAGRLYLSQTVIQLSQDPEAIALRAERDDLNRKLDDLRRQKNAMNEELYFDELQRLLLEVARVDARLRQIEERESPGESPGESGDDTGRADDDGDSQGSEELTGGGGD